LKRKYHSLYIMGEENKNDNVGNDIASADATTAAISSLLDYDEEDDDEDVDGYYTSANATPSETPEALNELSEDNGRKSTPEPAPEVATILVTEEIPGGVSVQSEPERRDSELEKKEEILSSLEFDSIPKRPKPLFPPESSPSPPLEIQESKPIDIPGEKTVEIPPEKPVELSKKKKKTKKRQKTKRRKTQSPPPKPKQSAKKSKDDEALIRLALHRNPYFTCLDEEQIERFIDEAELVKDFRPGQAVIVEGPSGPHRWHNPSNIHRTTSGGGKAKLRRLKTNAGDVYGYEYFRGEVTMKDPDKDDNDLWWDDDDDDDDEDHSLHQSVPATAKSSYLYVIKNGKADVFYESINPATLGPSKMFGEGGFLFGRNHSASVVAATDKLVCFRVDRATFINKILPSQNMKRLYRKYASHSSTTSMDKDKKTGEEDFFMTMEDFLEFFKKERAGDVDSSTSSSSSLSASMSPIANAYQSILRGTSSTYHDEKNHVTLEDFCFFQFLMARPDPEIDIAFILMDRSKAGMITRSDFEHYLETSAPYFDRKGEFVERHFGQNRVIRVHQFSQFLHDLQRELGKQAFVHRAKTLALENQENATKNVSDPHIGYLPAETFIEVLKATSSWRLPDGVIDRLESLYCKPSIDSAESTALASVRAGTIKGDSPKQVAEYSRKSVLADLERRRNKLGTRHFTYVDFIAFQDVIVQLGAICNLIEQSCKIKKGPISPDDFKVANRVLGIGGRLSRQQVNIVFDLFDLDHDGYLSNEDAISVCGFESGSNVLEAVEGRDGKKTFAPPPNYPQNYSAASDGFGFNDKGQPLENMSTEERVITQTTQFSLSCIAGGFGIFAVYPLDLIKTRMMNQRAPTVQGSRLYQTSLDCLQKVIRYEGFAGLYRGLLPPLLAAGPEKIVKFTLNDMLRAVLSQDEDGAVSSSTHWLTEIISGGCAGACQLLVTNPLEIVKIRMQMQGENAKVFNDKGFKLPRGLGLHYMSFTEIIREMGTTGLYKGAAACLMRDIPFGAIYFPAYAACMNYFVNREGAVGASSSHILLSGTLAAVPASLLTNPMDLVKTRIQVASRPGEEIYSGIGDCIRKIHQNEGPAAFFKGSFPRVARIAPQFGLSLFAYEKFSQLIGFRGIAPPTNAPVQPRDYRTAFSNPSSGIESKAMDAESLIENIGLFKPPRS